MRIVRFCHACGDSRISREGTVLGCFGLTFNIIESQQLMWYMYGATRLWHGIAQFNSFLVPRIYLSACLSVFGNYSSGSEPRYELNDIRATSKCRSKVTNKWIPIPNLRKWTRHRGFSVLGAFKLDHLQPFELILFHKISNFLPFILGGPIPYYPRERK